MKYHVNENCIGCSLCAALCPAVFAMAKDGKAAAGTETVAPEHEAAAQEAMLQCPADAIEEMRE